MRLAALRLDRHRRLQAAFDHLMSCRSASSTVADNGMLRPSKTPFDAAFRSVRQVTLGPLTGSAIDAQIGRQVERLPGLPIEVRQVNEA